MKLSKRNISNMACKAEKIEAKPPLVSKYAAKVRTQMKELKDNE